MKTVTCILLLCLCLTGCAMYSGARALYIKSNNLYVFGPYGYIHCGEGSSVLISDQSYESNRKDAVLPWPTFGTVQNDINNNLNIGQPDWKMPMAYTPTQNTQPSLMETAASAATGSVPVPK